MGQSLVDSKLQRVIARISDIRAVRECPSILWVGLAGIDGSRRRIACGIRNRLDELVPRHGSDIVDLGRQRIRELPLEAEIILKRVRNFVSGIRRECNSRLQRVEE